MKTKIIAAIALCSSSLASIAFPTAAMAAVPTPTADMTAVCSSTSVVNPDPNSTYSAVLNLASISSSTGTEYEISRTTITNIPGGQLLSKVGPTYVGPLGRNGQSPNIFGTFKTVSTYSGGLLVQEVVYGTDTTFTYGCTVSKTNKNNGNVTTPPGLQVNGLTIVKTETRGPVTDTVSAPDYTQEELSEMVVCNSPSTSSKKTASNGWANQNGYTGPCSTELFLSLGTITIHSNSLPPLDYLEGPEDHNSSSSFNDSGPQSVSDDDWVTE